MLELIQAGLVSAKSFVTPHRRRDEKNEVRGETTTTDLLLWEVLTVAVLQAFYYMCEL